MYGLTKEGSGTEYELESDHVNEETSFVDVEVSSSSVCDCAIRKLIQSIVSFRESKLSEKNGSE